MKTRAVAMLMTLSLAASALLVAAAGQAVAAEATTRPWKCSDETVCSRSYPPSCFCLDKVDRCDVACARCEYDDSDPSGYVCKDLYHGDPGPTCTTTKDGGDHDEGAMEVETMGGQEEAAAAKEKDGVASDVAADVTNDVIRLPSDGSEGFDAGQPGAAGATTRPWKCCDETLCSRSYPPSCFCLDKVERCDGACARCEDDDSDPSGYVCKDLYHGDPGPTCTTTKQGGHGTAAEERKEREKEAAAEDRKEREEEAAAESKKGGGDEETRPWACCTNALCTKSFPPTCRCLDEVEECSGACHECQPSSQNPLRRVCNDQYHGDPGPTCSKDDDDVRSVAYGRSYPSHSAPAPLLLAFVVVAMVFTQNR